MRVYTLLFVLLLSYTSQGQLLSLEQCLEASRLNYPLIADFENLDQQLELKLKNLNTNYYPKLDVTGQYTWQNDVPGFDSPAPGFDIPKAPKQQYKAFVDVQQVIYDGGKTKAAKHAEQQNKIAEKQSVEVQLNSIRSKVIDSYFLILMIEEQEQQLDYRYASLKQRFEEMQSAVNNGVLLQSESDLFEVEILKLEQDRFALQEGREAALDVLMELTGKELALDSELLLPLGSSQHIRPEYGLFLAQQEQLNAYSHLTARKRMPVIAGFGQLGYGNPGYNMLKDELATFYMVGFRLSWNLWDWKVTSREKTLLQLQSKSVKTQEATFSKNLSLAESEIQSHIRKLEKVIEKDNDIIELRQRITASKQSQLTNGTITAADYINELNSESMAKLGKELHLIEKSRAEIELNELGLKSSDDIKN